jgi:hypothetical protein
MRTTGCADDHLHEECGVFGVYGHPDAAALTALGLHALQHRGQESAGIVAYDGEQFSAHRGPGLVSDNFSSKEVRGSVSGPLTTRLAVGVAAAAGDRKAVEISWRETAAKGVVIAKPVYAAQIARGPSGRTTVRASRVTSPMRIDGALDEEIYASLLPITDFIQNDPQEGAPSTEKTASAGVHRTA